ncbi:MAG: steroid 3-ketoacyl-CoA thiolase [Deltaproteobacteria bacterium]|jgi:acetyl-CoA C-acetyltransferase|nr:steroid 3-ketoacyl-CoA thiolase [Deltaproteobacteria bacterium]
MREVVIVEALRSPLGKRKGELAAMHALDLLGTIQAELFARTGMDPLEVGQVIGGCVGQVGMQAMNVTRNAWLAAGLPLEVAATTVDAQCGSSQQATNLAYALVAAGVVDAAVGCGVEIMSQVAMGATIPKQPFAGKPVNKSYWKYHEFTSQFEGAERIAKQWGFARDDTDAFGKLSQDRAAAAWAEGRFDAQIVPIEAPVELIDGKPSKETHRVERDGGLRETTLEGLAGLRTNLPEGIHTAGSSSQMTDGAAAVLMMTREKADALGLPVRAAIVDTCLVGSDPALMLTGPIPATRKLLNDNKMGLDDIDLVEINEAFASVVLAWEKELSPDMARVNPNGGAIALGHPLGGTGAVLITKALAELERADKEHAIVTMCCGGGLGTGTLLRRS